MENLGFYWIAKEDFFVINMQSDLEKEEFLLKRIHQSRIAKFRDERYMIMLNCQLLMVQGIKGYLQIPQFQFNLQLKLLNINIDREQIQQILTTTEQFNKFKRNSELQKNRRSSNLSAEENRQLEKIFREFFIRIEKSGNKIPINSTNHSSN